MTGTILDLTVVFIVNRGIQGTKKPQQFSLNFAKQIHYITK